MLDAGRRPWTSSRPRERRGTRDTRARTPPSPPCRRRSPDRTSTWSREPAGLAATRSCSGRTSPRWRCPRATRRTCSRARTTTGPLTCPACRWARRATPGSGLFKSFDGGQTWQSTLVPGYPQDQSADGLASPLKGFGAAADPVVRAGTDGLFYYSGITFNRGSNVGQVFVSRFIDLNNKENGDATQSKDPIRYLDTVVVDTGTSGQFLDKPWLAVDIPRAGARSCTIPVTPSADRPGGRRLRGLRPLPRLEAGPQPDPVRAIARLRCDLEPSHQDQRGEPPQPGRGDRSGPGHGSRIRGLAAVREQGRERRDRRHQVGRLRAELLRPGRGGRAHALRPGRDPDRSSARTPCPRSRSRWTGPASAACTWRGRSARRPSADARIVRQTSPDGIHWSTPPVYVDSTPLKDDFGSDLRRGPPVHALADVLGGRLMVLYYDQRLDHTLGYFTPNTGNPSYPEFGPDPVTGSFYKERRGTARRAAARPVPRLHAEHRRGRSDADPARDRPARRPGRSCGHPAASPPRASRATSSAPTVQPTPPTTELDQLEVNPPNLPMFKQGTLPFIGDYIEIAGLSFVPKPGGGWQFNTAPTAAPVHYAVWTSNQDVVPPPDGDWTRYTPVGNGGTSLFDPTQQRPACVTGYEGTRNQNIYSARITQGLLVYSPQNAKPLNVPRAFVVIVQNTTLLQKAFRLTLSSRQRRLRVVPERRERRRPASRIDRRRGAARVEHRALGVRAPDDGLHEPDRGSHGERRRAGRRRHLPECSPELPSGARGTLVGRGAQPPRLVPARQSAVARPARRLGRPRSPRARCTCRRFPRQA